ncbi:hypothetical protein HZA98_04700 [Candidatus Woesearchaeota archaeon]|nr:hypothetical protein [Candidatus Woesearchaeota archaeon]
MKKYTSSVSYRNRFWHRAPRLDTAYIAELFSEQLMQLPLEKELKQ